MICETVKDWTKKNKLDWRVEGGDQGNGGDGVTAGEETADVMGR